MRTKTLFAAIAALFLLPMAAAHAQIVGPTAFCGGPVGGNYQATMSQLAAGSFHAAVPVPTNGSLENLSRIDAGQCVAGPAQADAAVFYAKSKGHWMDVKPVAIVGEEIAHLVCADYLHLGGPGRLANVSDLAGRRDVTVAIGQGGSGSQVTWQVLTQLLPYLDPMRGGPQVNTAVDPTSMNTLNAVKSRTNGKLDCLFFVSTKNSDTMKRVDAFGASLELVGVNDPAIFNLRTSWGDPVYSLTRLPPGTYPNLQSSRFSPFYGNQPVVTLDVKSVMFANSRWYAANPSYAQWISAWASHLNYARY
jgi:TRAP-type uncharacterized transport system substrate-binding protein